jgi:hypothetical protein
MTIDNILTVTEEFTKRLQLPESKYGFIVTSNNEIIELVITVEGIAKMSLKITNGNIGLLYTDSYSADKYVALEFQTPITFLYQISILFFAAVKDVIQIDFNELLSIVLLEEIYDWKTLLYGLSENLNLSCEIVDDKFVRIEGVEIHYSGFENSLRIDDTEIELEKTEYTYIVEAMFKCVEYVANIMDVSDNLFQVEEEVEESNVMEEAPGEEGEMNVDMDVDMSMPEPVENNEPAPVESIETETFEEPQGPVVTMDDLL